MRFVPTILTAAITFLFLASPSWAAQNVLVFADPAGICESMADTDDLEALAYLDQSPQWNLIGIVLTTGNVHWSKQSCSLKHLGLDVPIITPDQSAKRLARAVGELVDQPTAIMVLSPATNLARILNHDPTILNQTTWIGMVGGRQIVKGQVEQFIAPSGRTLRDLNVTKDVRSFQTILRLATAHQVPVILTGWNATRMIKRDQLDYPALPKTVRRAITQWHRTGKRFWGMDAVPSWDLSAIQVWERPHRLGAVCHSDRAGFVSFRSARHGETIALVVGLDNQTNTYRVTNCRRR